MNVDLVGREINGSSAANQDADINRIGGINVNFLFVSYNVLVASLRSPICGNSGVLESGARAAIKAIGSSIGSVATAVFNAAEEIPPAAPKSK